MIDLHSHILPGLDDGSTGIVQSIEMAKIAVDSGIRAMAVTPHCIDDRRIGIRTALSMLRDALEEAQIPLKLYPGMEIMGSPSTADMLLDGRLITINGSRYPLVEFPFKSDGDTETNTLAQIVEAGYTPVVAHPERYLYVQEDPSILNLWKEMGCAFQVNRGSFLGHFGGNARILAYDMTVRGFTTIIASDAHSNQHRIPWMRDIKNILDREISPLSAQYLLRQNPLHILRNEDIPSLDPDWF